MDTDPDLLTAAPGDERDDRFGADISRLRSLTCIKWNRYPGDVIPAWVADMDFAPAPPIREALASLVERGDFGYNFAAHAKLPKAFAAWQERRHGWRPDAGRVRLFCDVMQAVETAVWLNTEPGDGVVLLTPVYHPFFPAVRSTGRRVVECPLVSHPAHPFAHAGTVPEARHGAPTAVTGANSPAATTRTGGSAPLWTLDADALERAVDERTRVILMCNPHNPTGRAFSREELEAIFHVAEAHDLVVISDEIWADLTHEPARHIPFASLSASAAARTITITAASKAFSIAGLHCAVAHIGHGPTRERIEELPEHILGAVGTPGAVATLAAWTQGEEWLGAVRHHLTGQRDHLAARLATELSCVRFAVPEATYLAWLDFRDTHVAHDPAGELLKHARVGLSPGPDFGDAGAGFARLNFATSRELLDEVIDRMVAYCGA